MYFNARSILPKLDDLRLMCISEKPDVVCIVETWLCSDITNNEIAIPEYTVHRLDRDRHGGGILIYCHCHLNICVLSKNTSNLEFMAVSVNHPLQTQKLHLALFYRPPSSSCSIFDDLQLCLEELSAITLHHFVLLGDFNVDYLKPSHPLFTHLHSIATYFFLEQVVSSPTHFSHTGNPSLIDLVFISCPDKLLSCVTVPPLGGSDHLGVHLAFKKNSSPVVPSNQRTVWRYKLANFERACELLDKVNWTEVLSGDINKAAQQWEEQFLNVMEQCIPKVTITPGHNLPWLTKDLQQAFRARNLAYKRAKRTAWLS